MTSREKEQFVTNVTLLAHHLHVSGSDVRAGLSPVFGAAFAQHPDEEDVLIELWDKLVARPVL